MFNISGIYDQDQIEHITIKYLEKKKEQIVKKEELEHFYLKSQNKYSSDIILTEGINKKRLNIFDAQKKYPQFVMVGEPGSGKSSSLLSLYSWNIEELLKSRNIKDIIADDKIKGVIPIFIELNMYRIIEHGENWIYNSIVNDLNSFIHNVNVNELTDYFLLRGKLLILLDGLNEVSIKNSARAVKEMKEFLLRYPNNKIIITVRQQDYKGYFSVPVLYIQKFDTEMVKKVLQAELSKKIGKKINIEEFYEHLDSRVKKLIQNPMLLMMFISIVKEDSERIPSNRGNLFIRFIEYWFEREEKKGIEKPKRIERIIKQSSLAALGFAMQMRGETRVSEEIVCEKLAKNLIKLENNKIIRKGKLGAVDVFNDLKSLGFIEENYGMVKFFHPSFMEYFAAVILKDKSKEEVLKYSDEVNWEETMNFYYGLIDDCSFFIEHFLNQNRVFDAANCIIFGESDRKELIEKVIYGISDYLKNKYEYYRNRAEEYLIKIDSPIVDSILIRLRDKQKDDTEFSMYREILRKREIIKKKELKSEIRPDESKFLISEKKPFYSTKKEFFYLLDKFKKDSMKGVFLEGMEEYFIEKRHPELADLLIKIAKNSSYDISTKWYAILFLEITLKKWGIDILFEILTKRQIKKFILDVEGLRESQIDKKYVMLNLLIDQRVEKRLRRELCVNHVSDIEEEGIAFYIINFVENNLARMDKNLSDVYSLVVESLFRIDTSAAEEYMIFLLKRYQRDKKLRIELSEILKDKVILEKHYRFFVSYLKEETDPRIKQNIISAISNTKDAQFLIPILSLIKAPKVPVSVKRRAIEAAGEIGDINIIPILKELSVDNNPEIYNSAFTALKKIERKNAFEERYLLKTDIREIEVDEQILDYDFIDEEKKFPKVKIYEDNKEIVEVENVMINLGPISGLIFYLIAVNARIDKPINIDNIVSKLKDNGIYIDRNRIKCRIADIRKKIELKLKDKVDPYFLIENVRRFGYRINASVVRD